MLKKSLAASALSLLSLTAVAQSSFTQLIVFGDSLMDTGNRGAPFTNQLTDGSGNYAQIAPQYFADYLNLDLEPAALGGTNYAVGGYQTADIFNSIAGTGISTGFGSDRFAYLVENFGVVQPGSLILMDGGGNDLRDILSNNPPAAVPDLIAAAAQSYVTSIGALHASGADYIMVANVPDLGVTPGVQLAEIFSPGAAAGFSSATAGYNQGVTTLTNLGLVDANIIPVDINGFVNYVLANAETYGLANGDLDVSAGLMLPAGTAIIDQRSMCYQATVTMGVPDCIEHPVYGINGSAPDPRRLFFNDSLHPTEISSEIFGDYLIDIVAAPMKVGLLPELALSAARTQVSASGNELRRSRWGKAQGRLFVSGDVSLQEYKGGIQPETDNNSLTVGRTLVASENLVYGGAITVGKQDLDIDGADFDSESWGVTGMVGYRQSGIFIDAMLGLSSLSYDGLKRDFKLGSQTLTVNGDTDGHAWTIDALAGFDLLSSESWHLAPAVGVQYINTTVDSYTETGGEISNYSWGEQRRKSLQWRYGLVASGELSQTLRVFAEVFGSREQRDEDQSISIRNTNFNLTSYHLPSYEADDNSFVSGTIGGSIDIMDDASVNLTYNYGSRSDGYQHVALSFSMPM